MSSIIEKINFKSLFSFIGVITFFELASFLSYRITWLNSLFFILICIATLVIAYKKLEWGLLVVLAELCIGSEGHLFNLTVHTHVIAIRIGLFVTILGVWFFKYAPWKRLRQYYHERTAQLLFLFFGVLIYSGLVGLLHHNQVGNLLADGQRYLYFCLFFVFWDVFNNLKAIYNFLRVLFAAIVTLTAKATIILILTINNFGNESSTRLIYRWVRTVSRVGEITDMKNGFFRVFIQSQIFELVAIFILSLFIAYVLNLSQSKEVVNRVSTNVRKYIIFYFSLLTLSCFAIVMGLSRSFWAAGIGTGICLLILMIWRFKMKWKVIITSLGLVIISGLISVMLINFVFGAGINKRVNASDPAASSRWKMLPPLIQEIKQHPIIGSGLGTTITYQSDDPRFKNETNPQGWLTTYAIEWGYLDFVLKFGIIGIMVYLWFLGFIVWEGWKLTKLGNQEAIIAGGFLLGLIVVGATHILSPYLNHPLGIGYVLISIGVFRALKISRELL